MNAKIVDAGKNTRFKPGQSGNPAGRPRRTSITDLLSFVLTLRPNTLKLVRPEVRANFPEAKTDAYALAMYLIIKAANKGDLATWREIRETVEGKTRYPISVRRAASVENGDGGFDKAVRVSTVQITLSRPRAGVAPHNGVARLVVSPS